MSSEARESLAHWVAQAQNGDREAFEEVFQRTHEHARKLAYSVVGPNHWDDVLQESYLLVFRKLKQLRDTQAFMGWFCRLILHVAYRHLKKNPKLTSIPESLHSKEKPEDQLDSLVLKKALSQLHLKSREVLVLRELLELTYEEVSEALQIPVGTVRSRLNKARKQLGERLNSAS